MTGSARRLPALHVVTDDRVLSDPGFPARARAVLSAGGPGLALHLRGAATSGRRIHDLARSLLPEARGAGALLFVNDRVDVAAAVGADGVQLGRASLPVQVARTLLPRDALLGASVHDVAAAVTAARGGADLLMAGSVYATRSHPGTEPAGTGLLSGVRDRVATPLVGIGGITPKRVPAVVSAGASGVAVLSGVWGADDPAGEVAGYLAALAAAEPDPRVVVGDAPSGGEG